MATNLYSPLPGLDVWPECFVQFHEHLPPTNRLILYGLINIPIFVVFLHIFGQLIGPRDRSLPPAVFEWLPYVGSAIQYGDDPLSFFFKCREKYGDMFTFTLLGRKVTVALGARGNNFVMGGKLSQVCAEEAYTNFTTPVFGKDVVFDVPNEVFMEQKRFVKFGLSTDHFRPYVGMIEDEVENFLKTDASFRIYQKNDINEWGAFDSLNVLSEITILTASRTLQGKEVRDGLDKSFAQLYADLDGGFRPINWLFPNLPLESYRKRDRAQKAMSDFYVDILQRRREGKSLHDEVDMMASLAEQRYKNGRELSDREIAHIMIALLMAGQHTSAATISWAMLHLADQPEIVEQLYQEQVKHFGGADGTLRPMTYEEIKVLPVLDSVIRETLRIHPPIHSIMRKVISDIPVPPTLSAPFEDGKATYVVPKGHFVLSSPGVSQMDPRVWKDPGKFDPSRWSDPEGVAAQAFKEYTDENGEKVDYGFGAISKGTESPYQPFGAGRHRCIGEQFAYLQIGTIIATLIRKLEFRMETPVPAHNYHTMITLPKDPRQICYRRRRSD